MWQRNWRVFRKIFLSASAPTFLEPVLYLLSLGLGLGVFVKEVGGLSYLEFIGSGLLASTVMFGATFETTFNSFVRMKYERVYDAVLATPLSVEDVIVGEIFWGATRSFLSSTAFLIVIAIFGLVKSPLAILILPVLFLSALMFGVFGMIFTALTNSLFLFNYYFTLVITPLFLFSGIFFPIDVLPDWAQRLAWFTPLYHVVRLSRSFVLGQINQTTLVSFLWITGVTALLFLVPVARMKHRLIR